MDRVGTVLDDLQPVARQAYLERRDPRVGLSIVGFRNPYDEAMIRGRIVERRPDPDLEVMDEISRKYTGKEFPWRGKEGRVVLVIEPDHVTVQKLPFDPPA